MLYNDIYKNLQDCSKPMNLVNIHRKLWQEYVMWTRSFIISTIAHLADLDWVTKRLFRNPKNFANELQRFYGDEKANKFEKLLTKQLTITADLVNSIKTSNSNVANEVRNKWYQNADEIASFLATINPYWSKTEWQKLFYDHLKMTEDAAIYRLTSQYAKDIAEYQKIETNALMIADYMAEGIMKQFKI